MTRASIIIPTYNRLDLLQRCIYSIRQYTEMPYEIIVVDNGSTDGTASWCMQQNLALLSLPRNEGFPIACNKGLRLSSGDTLVLLNNDTVVTKNWLSNMSAALLSSSEVGIVGPVTNYASGSQQVQYPFEDLAEFQRIAVEVNVSDYAKWVRVERIVGFCFVFRRSLMEKIGLLDERFSPGHYEDDDFCLRTRLHGFSLLVCHDALIFHEGSASFKNEGELKQQQLVERNYRMFMDKWNLDPRVFI
ncbi:glycosyltransferase family 2 protein [Cohnella herbarum]|uniref:Glycosyltransferase family 2 protein n=1 Tax=Cohnella herbarum TaxID=2728023 RepID=A0A7Z2ZLQ3_9BACL|nr:glycosyltransferase family 2 protein [Cohnella herbarum]QJD84080.1 glycosyltransferase family 2 protein [Cohnella herbarum]